MQNAMHAETQANTEKMIAFWIYTSQLKWSLKHNVSSLLDLSFQMNDNGWAKEAIAISPYFKKCQLKLV